MAVDYRFIGTNIDATLITDAPTGAKTFFVTELRGHDPEDIMGGINFGLQEYHEVDFIQLAMDNNYSLFLNDTRGSMCLVVPGVTAGRFNGTSSILQISDVTFASSGIVNVPLIFKQTIRFTQEDLDYLTDNPTASFTIFSTDRTEATYVIGLVGVSLLADPYLIRFVLVTSTGTLTVSQSLDIVPDMCIELEMRVSVENSLVTGTIVYNGDILNSATATGTITLNSDDLTLYYGAEVRGSTVRANYFRGIMRNLILNDSTGDLVNIVDPSDGTNTGSEADGVPTDITSVTVIV